MKLRISFQLFFLLFALVSTSLLLLFFHFNHTFVVNKIECVADGQACPEVVLAELKSYQGKSIFFTDFWQLGQRILKYEPSLQELKIEKKLPNQVEFSFRHAQPAYLLSLSPENQVWVIDTAGAVVATASSQNLVNFSAPTSLISPLQLGDRVSAEFHTGLSAFARQQSTLQLPFENIAVVSSSEIDASLTDQKKVLLKIDGSAKALAQLAFLLGHFDFARIKEPVTIIDLRFDHPVLRTNN